ncbi:hypothetical protein FA13DRAFT_1721372 [Coprinellus micaceus]|uniref:NACHT domain-containing protein n=1 Tax=Coprinellus micaceus TaxID=71717 RepID=A0A4Y7S0Y9_COPMI|nr:hypothetical protein FA13DRAFT_1721372 [Coprinellus micaceus]
MASPTSYLQGAHHNRFENLMITHVAGNAGRTAMEYLEEHITIGAIHNSDERCDAPTCFPETRVAVQEDILSWITQGDQDEQPMKMLWLSGPAGSGKTAIAGSVADSKQFLVATLAYQLFKHETLEAAAPHVSKAIQRDPTIFKMKLKDQLEALILNPLRQLRCQFPEADLPKVFIIDGVDETQHFLSASSSLVAPSVSSPNLRSQTQPKHRVKRFFLNKKYAPDSDIRLYLTSKFAEIRRRYNLSPSWPGQDIIEDLVRTASGSFIRCDRHSIRTRRNKTTTGTVAAPSRESNTEWRWGPLGFIGYTLHTYPSIEPISQARGPRCPGSVRAHEGDDNHPEQFLAKSWVALFEIQGTSHWIAPSEQKAFLEILAQPSNAESVSAACSKEVASLGEEELVACDVYWWMSQSFKELFLISRSPTAGGVYSLRNKCVVGFQIYSREVRVSAENPARSGGRISKKPALTMGGGCRAGTWSFSGTCHRRTQAMVHKNASLGTGGVGMAFKSPPVQIKVKAV